jgi:hypothetical protein
VFLAQIRPGAQKIYGELVEHKSSYVNSNEIKREIKGLLQPSSQVPFERRRYNGEREKRIVTRNEGLWGRLRLRGDSSRSDRRVALITVNRSLAGGAASKPSGLPVLQELCHACERDARIESPTDAARPPIPPAVPHLARCGRA